MLQDPLRLRFAIFFVVLLFFIGLEFFLSDRKKSAKRFARWPANLGMSFVSSFLIRALSPLGVAGVAVWANEKSLGLFHFLDIASHPAIFLASLVMLDLLIYAQHVLTHHVAFLWRLHRVHHSDLELDATSALRFHPLEIVFSFFYKSLFVLIFGFSATSVIVFEILLNGFAIFNHSNLHLPGKLEKILRYFIVTPQMHVVHHSIAENEQKKNYGFCFSFWDRWLNTYLQRSEEKDIGLKDFRSDKEQSFWELLIQPIKKQG